MLIANSIIPRASRWNTPGGYHARPVSGSRESSRAREPDRTKGEGEPSPEGSVNHHRLSRVESASEAALSDSRAEVYRRRRNRLVTGASRPLGLPPRSSCFWSLGLLARRSRGLF